MDCSGEKMMRKMKTSAMTAAVMALCMMAAGCTGNPSDQEAAHAAEQPVYNGASVSYLGPEGTYTEEAVRFFFPEDAQLNPRETVADAIADVVKGDADYAVIPQENTIGGAVVNYVDALIGEENVYVTGEVILPISQTLMGIPGTKLEEIKTVCSHAQGITQSKEWRKEHLPDAETQEMASTAAAASYVAETGDQTIAAIAAPAAADLYGLEVLAENVQITDTNKTRFYVLTASLPSGNTYHRAVFVADCEANRIDDVIIGISEAGLELVTIHDRPEGSYLGSYHYIIEAENKNGDAITSEQIEKVRKIPEIRYLGSFDVIEKKN
jgi:prephenate dehydratase/chorismate mutase/prephenate dehydratase